MPGVGHLLSEKLENADLSNLACRPALLRVAVRLGCVVVEEESEKKAGLGANVIHC